MTEKQIFDGMFFGWRIIHGESAAFLVKDVEKGMRIFAERMGRAPEKALISKRSPYASLLIEILEAAGVDVELDNQLLKWDLWLRLENDDDHS